MKNLEPESIIITNRKDGTRRVQYDCSHDKTLTDQSSAKDADINNIMAYHKKTGMMPQVISQGDYRDNSTTPSLEEAFKLCKDAQDLFYALPPSVRKLVDNDPAQLENLLSDPHYADLLLKEGVLVERKPDPKIKVPDNKVIQAPVTTDKEK